MRWPRAIPAGTHVGAAGPQSATPAAVPEPQRASASGPAAVAPNRALLNRYCVTCHNERLKTAGLMLDKVDVDNVGAHAEILEKIVRKLRSGQMPPEGRPRPDPPDTNAFCDSTRDLARPGGSDRSQPRTVASRRLNRAEYVNAIHDLLALEVDGAGAAADRDGRLRFRQQRRRALDHAGADGPLHVRGDEDQPPGCRQSRQSPGDPGLQAP